MALKGIGLNGKAEIHMRKLKMWLLGLAAAAMLSVSACAQESEWKRKCQRGGQSGGKCGRRFAGGVIVRKWWKPCIFCFGNVI